MHPVAFGIGILILLAGLFVTIVGAIASIWWLGGLIPVGIGWDLMIAGAVTAVVAVFL
jgi:hypothetical protein